MARYELRYDGWAEPIAEEVALALIDRLRNLSSIDDRTTSAKAIALLDGRLVHLLMTTSTPIAVFVTDDVEPVHPLSATADPRDSIGGF